MYIGVVSAWWWPAVAVVLLSLPSKSWSVLWEMSSCQHPAFVPLLRATTTARGRNIRVVEQDTSHQHSTVEPFFFTQRLPPPPEVCKLQVQALDCCICLHCYQRCCAYLALVFPNVFEFRSVIIYFSTDGPPRAGAMAWPSCLRPRPDPLLNGEAAVFVDG